MIHPMLATPVDKPFDDDAWLYEIKWDGYRAVAFVDGKSIRLVSRNQTDLTSAYPELHEIVSHIKAGTAVLDGEIVALDDDGAGRLLRRRRPAKLLPQKQKLRRRRALLPLRRRQ